MSIITKIELRGSNADIYVDNEFYGSLSYFVVRTNRMTEGGEIDMDRLYEISLESDVENARAYAYRYLSKYSCTKSKLIAKIKERDYPYAVAKIVADMLEEDGYIDDYKYVDEFIESKSKVWGHRRIKSELLAKGAPSAVIDERLAEQDKEQLWESAKTTARQWFGTHYLEDRKDSEKFYRFMSYRGYDYSTITKCKDWLLKDGDDNDE